MVATGPCPSVCTPFATVEDLSTECAALDNIEEWLDVTSDLLYELTGERWPGSCSETIRPTTRTGCFPWWYSGLGPGVWGLPRCGCSGGSASCCFPPRILLGAEPVTEITQVLIDGEVLDPSAYHIEDFRYLARIDGEGWPACQALELDATEVGTFEITFTYGTPPPVAVKRAAIKWACELAKQEAGDDDCELPDNTTSITRQGVTISMTNSLDIIREGGVGLPLVDAVIHTYNPNRLQRSGSVWNPDMDYSATRIT